MARQINELARSDPERTQRGLWAMQLLHARSAAMTERKYTRRLDRDWVSSVLSLQSAFYTAGLRSGPFKQLARVVYIISVVLELPGPIGIAGKQKWRLS